MDNEKSIKIVSASYITPNGETVTIDVQYRNDMDHTIMLQLVQEDSNEELELATLFNNLIIPMDVKVKAQVLQDIEYMSPNIYNNLHNTIFNALNACDTKIEQDYGFYLKYGYYIDLSIEYNAYLPKDLLIENHSKDSVLLSDIMMVFVPELYIDIISKIIQQEIDSKTGLIILCNISTKYIYQYYLAENKDVKSSTDPKDPNSVVYKDGETLKDVDSFVRKHNLMSSTYAEKQDDGDKSHATMLLKQALTHSKDGTLDGIASGITAEEIKSNKLKRIRADMANRKKQMGLL